MTAIKNTARPAAGEITQEQIITEWLTQPRRYYQQLVGDGPLAPVGRKRESFWGRVRDFVYGMTGWEFERQATEMRGALENVFLTVTLGDMLGLPVLPPIYSLRLLPYAVPHIATWKRRVSRRRELPESEEYDLHGM